MTDAFSLIDKLPNGSSCFSLFSMIIEEDERVGPFKEWIGTAVVQWLIAVGVLLLVAVLLGLVFSLLRNGVAGAFPALFRGIARGMEDFLNLSPRRTWAIASLVIKDSIRKRVVSICVVFILILMFAGWYLDANAANPGRLYISFVMNATCYLILFMTLFLSAFSLPADFKTKTIYTIVTKPVRASEMVFGRILGIGIVGTVILIFMATCSYLFVSLSLNHTHILTQSEDLSVAEKDLSLDPNSDLYPMFEGNTRLNNSHQHKVTVLKGGDVRVEEVNGHTHRIRRIEREDGTVIYDVEPARGMVQARVPLYGKLLFRGPGNLDDTAGINVGDEWFHRTFIGGGSKSDGDKNMSAAFWTFDNVSAKNFPNGLPVEMTLGLFRTHKGDIEKTLYAKISVRNPKTGLMAEALLFNTQEFVTVSVVIPREIDESAVDIVQRRRRGSGGEIIATPENPAEFEHLKHKENYDLFEDFVADGKLEIWLQCNDSQQYIGVAESDLYIRAGDAPVWLNFIKGYFGIWQQMLLLLSFGVLLSTFLSGPVSMISTLGVLIAGFCKPFLMKIGLGSMGVNQEGILGGGPFESFWRLLSGTNMMSDLPPGFATTFVQSMDAVVGAFMTLIGQAIPPLSSFSLYYKALQDGFDISGAWMLQHGITTFAYVIPLFMIGYLILSNREVAK